nr:hypothetical protein [Tanacetum cinerariifolium]
GIDLYDSDCDEVPTAQASFMANISGYGSGVLSKVPHYETYQNDMANQSVQAMQYFEQTPLVDYPDNEITSDSNIILMTFEHSSSSLGPHCQMTFEHSNSSLGPYFQMTLEHSSSSLGPHCKTMFEHSNSSLDPYCQMASANNTSGPAPHRKERCTLQCALSSKEEKSSYLRAVLSTTSISSHDHPVVVAAPKAVDPVGSPSSTTIDQDVPSASTSLTNQEIQSQAIHQEHAFWLPFSNPKSEHLNDTQTSVRVEVPKELLKVSLVNISVKRLKYHLANFDKVMKVRTTPNAITEGSWGFEDTKKVFNDEVIPFKNSLQTLVKDFKNGLLIELNEVKTMFNQIEVAVDQYVVHIVMHADVKSVNVLPMQNTFLDDNIVLDVMKMENDPLMELLVSQDLVYTSVNLVAAINDYKNRVAVAAPKAVDPVGSPSSTTIDQDVSSASTSLTNQEIQSQDIHQDPSSEETTLQGFIHHLNHSFDTLTMLTKNHPFENVIGDPSRSVSTRSQLQEHAIWCYFDTNDNLISFGEKRSG